MSGQSFFIFEDDWRLADGDDGWMIPNSQGFQMTDTHIPITSLEQRRSDMIANLPINEELQDKLNQAFISTGLWPRHLRSNYFGEEGGARRGQVWEQEDEQALLLVRRICASANLEVVGPVMFANRSSGAAMSQFARMLRRDIPAGWDKSENNMLLRLYVEHGEVWDGYRNTFVGWDRFTEFELQLIHAIARKARDEGKGEEQEM
jgi:hypothetical protein